MSPFHLLNSSSTRSFSSVCSCKLQNCRIIKDLSADVMDVPILPHVSEWKCRIVFVFARTQSRNRTLFWFQLIEIRDNQVLSFIDIYTSFVQFIPLFQKFKLLLPFPSASLKKVSFRSRFLRTRIRCYSVSRRTTINWKMH